MSALDKSETAGNPAQNSEASNSNLFSAAFDKGLTVIQEHKVEAAAVGTAALAAAAIVLSRGRVLGGLVRDGVELEAGSIATSSAKALAPGAKDLGKGLGLDAMAPRHGLGTLGATKDAGLFARGLDPLATYDKSAYQMVPARTMASSIRLAEGPTMSTVDGPSGIVFGSDNSIQSIRFSAGSTAAEKSDLVLRGAYAGLIHSDPLAAQAASKIEGQSIGFISRPIERWATTEQMQQNAVEGARAYVEGDAAAANKFTEFLTERYGPMTAESRAWGTKILTDTSSPESAWNHVSAPATETLIQAGIPIDPLHRAIATNASVLKAEPWAAGATIRGTAEYMQASAREALPAGASQLGKDSWYGAQAPALSPELVKTIGSLSQSLGEKVAADTAAVKKVAELVGAHGKPEEYVTAYRALDKTAKMARVTDLSHLFK
ncbi:MAG: hypothetical protein JSS83_21520 [Cyanobacteria bacterium SZAS LIN-3]|nr:hypothetical protein [Cyanobacteria bacterium SZAS LIN-3]